MNNFIFTIVICFALIAFLLIWVFILYKDKSLDCDYKVLAAFLLGFTCMSLIYTISNQYRVCKFKQIVKDYYLAVQEELDKLGIEDVSIEVKDEQNELNVDVKLIAN